ncbi:hypothetical protein [Halalkalibacter urbisdiaboli]|uniref:hypothetical protein n=1 Tax=Halalkalibacter urbisdiaboli TaxID=1960589 RepID=UPI000B43AE57|nr:hypothetical protein [Halalkalibacter urbisdiaboli]
MKLGSLVHWGLILLLVFLLVNGIVDSFNNVKGGVRTDMSEIMAGEKNTNVEHPLQLFNNTGKAIETEVDKGVSLISTFISILMFIALCFGGFFFYHLNKNIRTY